jgi:hypothetical protein
VEAVWRAGKKSRSAAAVVVCPGVGERKMKREAERKKKRR